MADISSYLKKILEAIYGEEVRGSIHDALAAMNQESSNAMEFAATAKDSAAASAENYCICFFIFVYIFQSLHYCVGCIFSLNKNRTYNNSYGRISP